MIPKVSSVGKARRVGDPEIHTGNLHLFLPWRRRKPGVPVTAWLWGHLVVRTESGNQEPATGTSHTSTDPSSGSCGTEGFVGGDGRSPRIFLIGEDGVKPTLRD